VGGISTDAGSFIPKWKELAAQSEATKQLKQAIPLENLRAKIKDGYCDSSLSYLSYSNFECVLIFSHEFDFN